ncbi:hypothetical protein L6452_17540 [Arctium lappa]|uniref:Uncharacterized protein n=1 Tax=Arctium lappa TaxID=4217 RepID=A0ACB9C3W0_ARCLA|nr:hypothetical protein L6452_17540 [Arctium lappa]
MIYLWFPISIHCLFLKRSRLATPLADEEPKRSLEAGWFRANCRFKSPMLQLHKGKNIMLDLLREKFPKANDFGSEVIPGATSIGLRVLSKHDYDGAVADIFCLGSVVCQLCIKRAVKYRGLYTGMRFDSICKFLKLDTFESYLQNLSEILSDNVEVKVKEQQFGRRALSRYLSAEEGLWYL